MKGINCLMQTNPKSNQCCSTFVNVYLYLCLCFTSNSTYILLNHFSRYCIVFKVAKAMKACRRSKDTSALRRGKL